MNILYILLIYILCMSLSLLEDTMSYWLYSLWSYRLYSLRFMFSKNIISKIYSIFSIGWGIPGVAVFYAIFLVFLPSFQTRIPNTRSQHGRPQRRSHSSLREVKDRRPLPRWTSFFRATIRQWVSGRWVVAAPLYKPHVHWLILAFTSISHQQITVCKQMSWKASQKMWKEGKNLTLKEKPRKVKAVSVGSRLLSSMSYQVSYCFQLWKSPGHSELAKNVHSATS